MGIHRSVYDIDGQRFLILTLATKFIRKLRNVQFEEYFDIIMELEYMVAQPSI